MRYRLLAQRINEPVNARKALANLTPVPSPTESSVRRNDNAPGEALDAILKCASGLAHLTPAKGTMAALEACEDTNGLELRWPSENRQTSVAGSAEGTVPPLPGDPQGKSASHDMPTPAQRVGWPEATQVRASAKGAAGGAIGISVTPRPTSKHRRPVFPG